MPVAELAQHFSDSLGAPTKEPTPWPVFLADFFGWTAQEAAEAYLFSPDVQYALNLEPAPGLRATVERYQKLFREDDLAARVFEEVTTPSSKRSISMLPTAARLDPCLQPHGQLRTHQTHRHGDQAVLDPAQAARPRRLRRTARGPPPAREPRRRGSSPTPRTPKPAPAAASRPPRTSASSSTASPPATSPTVRPLKL